MVYILNMIFEFDPKKSKSNKLKHGIDFLEAQKLWSNQIMEFRVVVTDESESRSVVIGLIDDKFWTAIITYRGENIRIISVRRSRDEERKAYKG